MSSTNTADGTYTPANAGPRSSADTTTTTTTALLSNGRQHHSAQPMSRASTLPEIQLSQCLGRRKHSHSGSRCRSKSCSSTLKKVSTGKQTESFEPKESCPICLEPVDTNCKTKTGRSVQLKPCNHVFHRKCAKQWFVSEAMRGKVTPTCPLCRSQVEPSKVPLAPGAAGRMYRLFARAMSLVAPGEKSERRQQQARVSPTLRLYLTNAP